METETHGTTLADVTRLQAEIKELLEKYTAGDVEGLEAAQRDAEQVRDKLQSVVADSVTDQKIDNLVGVDGKKLATTNKLFEDRLHGIGNQIRTALTRIWDTVAARVSQATTKSSDMSQQPGMSPG